MVNMRIRRFKNVNNLQIHIRKMRGSTYLGSASIYLEIVDKDSFKEPKELLDFILARLKKEGLVE